MPVALYPGTFDPVTNGHIDIALRASRIFKKVYAVVTHNAQKKCLFSIEERVEMLTESLKDIKNIHVEHYTGLVVDCVAKFDATVIIRGVRALSDFDYEFQMAFTNRQLNSRADTVFLMPSARYTYLSSTLIKNIAQYGGDVTSFLPAFVVEKLRGKYVEVQTQ